jgi:uncharacterized protein YeaO (DUF488 family)
VTSRTAPRRRARVAGRHSIGVARVYDADGGGGFRVLVDRLWPRGIGKADAPFDEWLKDVAPSTELRRWYGHDVDRFDEFARRYREELRKPPTANAVDRLVDIARLRAVTLLTATRDVEHSAARVLEEHLTRRTTQPVRSTRAHPSPKSETRCR